MKKWFALAAVIAAAFAAHAQKFDLTIDNIMRGPGLVGWSPEEVRWTPDGAKVFFSWKQYSDPLEKDRDTYVVNRDGSGLRRLSDEEKKDAPPPNGDRTRDKQRIVYSDEGDIWLWDGKRHAITQTTDAESSPHFTFDEKRVTFVRANNVFAVDLTSGETTQLTNVAGPDDKGPNVTLWDDKKGTDSQEVVKKEEKQLLDVVARRAKKREEDEAKRKREHPLKPFKLSKGQTIADGRLTPDGKSVVVVVNSEPEKGKRTIVPNYVTESAYVETIPGREKVGDVQTSSRIAVLSEANGEVKWFEHGMTVAPSAEKPQEREQKTEKEKAKTNEREVSLRAPIWSEDGKHAFVVVRSTDNKDLWIMAFDPAAPKGRAIVSLHDDAWIRWAERSIDPGWADNDTIFYASEATGFMHLLQRAVRRRRAEAAHQRRLRGRLRGAVARQAVVLPDHQRGEPVRAPPLPDAGRRRRADEADVDDRREPGRGLARRRRGRERLLVHEQAARALRRREAHHHVACAGVCVVPMARRADRPHRRARQGPAPGPHLRAGEAERRGGDLRPRRRLPAERDPLVVELLPRVHVPPHPHGARLHGARRRLPRLTRLRSGLADGDLSAHGRHRSRRPGRRGALAGAREGDRPEADRDLRRQLRRLHHPDGDVHAARRLRRRRRPPPGDGLGALQPPLHVEHPQPAAGRRGGVPQVLADAQGLKGRLLICHGMVDTNVHFEDSVRLAQKLIELRKTNWELAAFPVENHGFVEPTSWADEYKRIYKLFEETIGR